MLRAINIELLTEFGSKQMRERLREAQVLIGHQSKNGFQVSSMACNSSFSSSRISTSGGRTGPPCKPAISINAFMVDTSYPLRRARMAYSGITEVFISEVSSS